MMTSDGHVEMQVQEANDRRRVEFRSQYPMPEECSQKKILKALEKLAGVPMPIKTTDAALMPLTPMEKGYVLGVLAEYMASRR